MSFLKLLNFGFSNIFAIKEERYVQDTIEDDCWEMIFKLVQEDDPNDFVSLSLVCKRFLSITNQMKISLVVSESTVLNLPRALRRFQNLRSICIGTERQPFDDFELLNLMIFPREGLRELGMVTNGLKKLKCISVSLYDADLILLTDLFPCLEEIYLNCYKTFNVISARGVEVLASKLKKLKRATFSRCTAVTDETIRCLSSNCKDLTSLELQYCENVTENAIGFLMRHSSKLTSLILALSCKNSPNNESQFTIENSISYVTNLEEIQFWEMDISDDFLCSIAKSCASLKRLDMDTRWWRCNFSMRGLETILKACSSIKSFTPRALWLTDDHMFKICEYLRGLTYIDLSNAVDSFSSLTCVTFFMLTQNCPLLETIVMDNTKVGTMEDVELVLVQNLRVKYLSMNHCELLNDRALLRFVGLCPNLESLDISSCREKFTDEGMAEIFKACPELKHLNISYVKLSNFLGSDNYNRLKLKTIQAENTWIDDEALVVIRKRCCDLEELKMGWCDRVTGYGIIVLVSMCKKLKRIDMHKCKLSSPKLILDWMLAKRPSFKEIVAPSGFVPSEEQRNLFLSKGCVLRDGYFFWERGIDS